MWVCFHTRGSTSEHVLLNGTCVILTANGEGRDHLAKVGAVGLAFCVGAH
jgi:hypothetical protein